MIFRHKFIEKSLKNVVLSVFLVLAPGGPGGWGRENMDGPWVGKNMENITKISKKLNFFDLGPRKYTVFHGESEFEVGFN